MRSQRYLIFYACVMPCRESKSVSQTNKYHTRIITLYIYYLSTSCLHFAFFASLYGLICTNGKQKKEEVDNCYDCEIGWTTILF